MYHFPLEPLLNHRRLLEEERQKELAALEARRLEVVHQLDAISNARRRWQAQRLPAGVPTDGGLLVIGERYLQRLENEAVDGRRRLAEAERAVKAKRRELLEVVKSRKILEKLKEKKLHHHRAAEARKMQTFLNEMAVTRFRR